ncbi:EAL domain-containing protein [Massilia sp. CMS3.1]|uniref:bifunctional diguanylate cyclase/phosphodiesterase n=1 Tax=Massilia sp. CMS3.1 TaxID=3373083 RepID=UPI003EE7BCF8
MKPASSSLSRTNYYLAILWPLLAIFCCLAYWAVTVSRANTEAEQADADLLKEADSYAQAYEQYVTRSIAQMDQITMQLKYGWERAPSLTVIEDMRADGMFTDQAFVFVGIVGADGRVRSSSKGGGLPHSVAQMPFFLQHKNNNSTALRVDLAPRGLEGGGERVLFTRRLDSADEEFDGIVVMAVDGDYFTSFVGASTLGHDGLLTLVDTEGKSWIEQGARTFTADGRILRLRATGGPTGGSRPIGADGFRDGVARALGWRDSPVYPVVAMVALSRHEGQAAALMSWKAGRDRVFAVSACLLLLSGLASVLSLRAAARERDQEAVRLAYRTATESADEGFYMAAPLRDRKGQIVDFMVVDCNERGASFYGMRRAELVGRAVSTIDHGIGGAEVIATYQLAMSNGFYEEDRRMPANDKVTITWGRRRVVRVGDGLAVTLQDISERKRHETELERLANEDPLTGLRNRSWLLNFIPALLDGTARDGAGLALLFIDLDEFKHVNDSHGHAVGDQLLTVAARRLGTLLRPGDQVVRFGGDEFVVLLHPGQDERAIAAVAERIVAAFKTPFVLDEGIQAVIGASVGISLFPRDGADARTLIRHADIAMYAAKDEGKGQYRFFDPRLAGEVSRRVLLKEQLTGAIERDQFFLHYQPRVDPASGTLLSMEALVRWRHPDAGMVSPGDFIPLAESSGLILQIGALVIEKACAQLAAWREGGMLLVPVSINVSPMQFGGRGVVRQLESALRRHGLPAALVEVEITESAMMGDHAEIAAELAQLRALGIKLHLDDFGTGYSSLSQLRALKMDVLKVDRTFTAELEQADGKVFFEAIVSMAHALGMTVVAEGVETAAQLRILRELGCDEVQGFYIARPLPAHEIEARFLAAPIDACA